VSVVVVVVVVRQRRDDNRFMEIRRGIRTKE
jgi:hypothetical protein